MADEELVKLLKQGADAWNEWRKDNQERQDLIDLIKPPLSIEVFKAAFSMKANLSHADLSGADLKGANLGKTNFFSANLSLADLKEADLSQAVLTNANLLGADLLGANLTGAFFPHANLNNTNLTSAKLEAAVLTQANLFRANLTGADLQEAILFETVFADVDLSAVTGLETCRHEGPSIIDFRTLQRSGTLPLAFLRGVGLPDSFIDYLPSLLKKPIQMYSCFISYSSKDQEFAERLHADLQDKGVRCWFAPHDMPTGAKIWDAIDAAIKLQDKLLLILSEHSIASDWVEDEVTRAFAEERDRDKRDKLVLFPVRIDDTVMETSDPWARKLRDQRNIGDFRKWKEHDAYQKGLEKLLGDLKVKKPKGEP